MCPFQDIASLHPVVETTLNLDSRMDANQPKTPRPDLMIVHEEIQKAHRLVKDHENDLPDDFPQNLDQFKFLRMIT